jgi:GNAT superfamily N-acetyltransferase
MQPDPTFGPYDPSLAPAVVALWNRTIGAAYPLREALFRQNLDRNPNFRPTDAVAVRRGEELVGFGLLQRYRGDAPLCREWRRYAWLAAAVVAPEHQRGGIGTRLVEWLTARAEGSAPAKVMAGGGIFWFFPGAPTDLPAARPFLASLGYRFGGTVYYDVRADLSAFTLPAASERVIADQGLAVRLAEPGDVAPLLAFLAAEFGAGWWHNADQFFRAGGAPSDWLLLVRGAEIVGMAQLHHAEEAVISAPRYWRAGPEAGGFGPIGVAASLRGASAASPTRSPTGPTCSTSTPRPASPPGRRTTSRSSPERRGRPRSIAPSFAETGRGGGAGRRPDGPRGRVRRLGYGVGVSAAGVPGRPSSGPAAGVASPASGVVSGAVSAPSGT